MIFIIIFLFCNATLVYSSQKNIQPKPKEISIECNHQGYPKTEALKALITTKYLRQIKQDQIAVKEVSGGYFTEKMYVITTKKNNKTIPLLFFKISKKFDSAKKLIKLQEGKIGQTFMEYGHKRSISAGKTQQDLPIIIWLEDLVTYKNQKGETKTIEVTTAAKGETLEDILNSQNPQMIKEAANCLGKSLAAFHQIYLDYDNQDTKIKWKTVCHGDFSIKNTLYDTSLKKIYFIDNETMHEGSIAQDIRTILINLNQEIKASEEQSNLKASKLTFCIE